MSSASNAPARNASASERAFEASEDMEKRRRNTPTSLVQREPFCAVAQGRFGLTNAEVDKIFPKQKYAPVKLFA